MWSTATVEPYFFDRFSTVIMWVPLVVGECSRR
jgi:hypothetical protein